MSSLLTQVRKLLKEVEEQSNIWKVDFYHNQTERQQKIEHYGQTFKTERLNLIMIHLYAD